MILASEASQSLPDKMIDWSSLAGTERPLAAMRSYEVKQSGALKKARFVAMTDLSFWRGSHFTVHL
ncbi:hypothetical protein EF888_01440 [Silicimonas algicola]|uniref:Uncharacterized protein n=1 Tax=Silicimonas algicola TaxID=1826607 RepID=A0A316FQC1_9RHOB|nr:hypothetical protein [Silicimonas algicola]AZQ65911.1 hypothetical protein EF888_01440 [Silicimonas algicola]PWK50971.1 hypothetical protein C8D95_1193 [Silicimonas algicola]